MRLFPFNIKKSPKSFLGVDVGTSAIRVVELSRKGQNLKLENYGEIKTVTLEKMPRRIIEEDSLFLSNKEIAAAISAILKTAGIRTREVNFSLPDFSTFFTSFELPPMSEKELVEAIKYEARSYIPLPLSEITLDWSIIEGKLNDKLRNPVKVLVAAIPNEIINQYQEIASLAGLEMKSLEAEVFALCRPINENEKEAVAVIDVGARSTTVNVLERGVLKLSHSFNISGNELTDALSRSLRVNYEKAEELKKKLGLIGEAEKSTEEVLAPLVDLISMETKKVFQVFHSQEGKEVEKVILAGGTVLLPGFIEYFSEELKKEAEIINPFRQISYPPILEEVLKEMGPSYAIAVGLAMKDLK